MTTFSSPSAAKAPSRRAPPTMTGQRAGSEATSLSLNSMRCPVLASSAVMIISWVNSVAPPRPSSGESSLNTKAMPETGELPWLAARVPTKGLRSKASAKVRELRALTRVAPTLTKSPIWAVARLAIKLVALVNSLGSRAGVVPTMGRLARENNTVASYLSAAKSSCTPLKLGLEKVSGVRVVRIRSPTVRA